MEVSKDNLIDIEIPIIVDCTLKFKNNMLIEQKFEEGVEVNIENEKEKIINYFSKINFKNFEYIKNNNHYKIEEDIVILVNLFEINNKKSITNKLKLIKSQLTHRNKRSIYLRYTKFLQRLNLNNLKSIKNHIEKKGFKGFLQFKGKKNEKYFLGIKNSENNIMKKKEIKIQSKKLYESVKSSESTIFDKENAEKDIFCFCKKYSHLKIIKNLSPKKIISPNYIFQEEKDVQLNKITKINVVIDFSMKERKFGYFIKNIENKNLESSLEILSNLFQKSKQELLKNLEKVCGNIKELIKYYEKSDENLLWKEEDDRILEKSKCYSDKNFLKLTEIKGIAKIKERLKFKKLILPFLK